MRPSICPDDPIEALERLEQQLHLLPGALVIDALWLRNGVRAYLAGQACSIDAALGLDRNTLRRLRATRRARNICRLADAVGLGPTWACAGQVLAIVAGLADCPAGLELERDELCKDPKTARSVEHVYRLICAATDVK